MMDLTSIYLHIPFCIHRCAYCDFNTYAGVENLIPAYVEALCQEILWIAQTAGKELLVHTVYLGGGTPSLLSLSEIENLLNTLRCNINLMDDPEITMEANPGTLTQEYLLGLFALGVNRISLGMQSAHPNELRILDRTHDHPDVIRSMDWARRAGYININIDLIFGIPGQDLDAWKRSLELTLRLRPEHLSLYSLTLEDGTPMERWARRGLLTAIDPDIAADMYELAGELLDKTGYKQYEISNWARLRAGGYLAACRHNLQYWRGNSYLGLGAGAHGYVDHIRTVNVLTPSAYIERMALGAGPGGSKFPYTPATMNALELTENDEMGEMMIMGLRLTQEGVPEEVFYKRFGRNLDEVYDLPINNLEKLGLLEWIDKPRKSLRLTKRGHLLGNQVFREFI